MSNRQRKSKPSATQQLYRRLRRSRVALAAMRISNAPKQRAFTRCLGGCGRLVLESQGECRHCRKHRILRGVHRVLGKGSGPDPRKRHA